MPRTDLLALDLNRTPTDAPTGLDKAAIKVATAAMASELASLQELLYANRQHSLLVVLQGLDTSGKDSSIKQVFRDVNAMGIDIHSFKAPTSTELAQDFLWRAHKRLPPRGLIGIFNRSHYEAAVTDRVMGFCDRATQLERCQSIRDFERHLAANGTLVYLNAGPSLDAWLARVPAVGGSVALPKVTLPEGMGCFAHIIDSEGNRVGLHALARCG